MSRFTEHKCLKEKNIYIFAVVLQVSIARPEIFSHLDLSKIQWTSILCNHMVSEDSYEYRTHGDIDHFNDVYVAFVSFLKVNWMQKSLLHSLSVCVKQPH